MKVVVKLVTVFIGLWLVVGCSAQPKKLPMLVQDPVSGKHLEAYVSATTVKDSTDRSVTYDQLGVATGQVDANGDPVLRAIGTQRTTGGTTIGRVLEGAVPGVATAATQGYFLKEAAKIKADAYKCPPGSTLCHSTYIDGAESVSVSESGSNAAAGSSVEITEGCPSASGCDF